MSTQREYIAALTAVLERNGIHDWSIDKTGAHPKIIFTHKGRSRFYVFPGSPSDGSRGLKNAVSDLRRMVEPRKARPVVRSSKRKKAPLKKRARKAPAFPAITVGPDAMAPLKGFVAMPARQVGKASILKRALNWLQGRGA